MELSVWLDGISVHFTEPSSFVETVEGLFSRIGVKVEVQINNLWKGISTELKDIATEIFSRCRIIKYDREFTENDFQKTRILPVVQNYEKRRIEGKVRSYGVVYDALFYLHALKIALKEINKNISFLSSFDVVLTNQLIATYGDDNRYHLRVCVLSAPHLISVSGIFAAPAKPKEYHIIKGLSPDLSQLYSNPPKGKTLSKIVSSYILNAFYYQMRGEGFCESRDCLLSDPHFYNEVLQVKANGKICNRHR